MLSLIGSIALIYLTYKTFRFFEKQKIKLTHIKDIAKEHHTLIKKQLSSLIK